MNFTAEESVIIDCKREKVWDYVIEHDEWRRPQVLKVKKLNNGPTGEGSRYEDTVRFMGRELTIINKIERFERPRYLSWAEIEGEMPVKEVEGSYRLKSLEKKTRFTLKGRYQVNGLWSLLTPLIKAQLQYKTYPSILNQLKNILEGKEYKTTQ